MKEIMQSGFLLLPATRLSDRGETVPAWQSVLAWLRSFPVYGRKPCGLPLHQRPQAFSHAPANIAQNLQAVRPGDKKCQTAVAQDADGLGKALKGLQVKAGQVETLELVFGIGHEKN